jgi:hypothetical protein
MVLIVHAWPVADSHQFLSLMWWSEVYIYICTIASNVIPAAEANVLPMLKGIGY